MYSNVLENQIETLSREVKEMCDASDYEQLSICRSSAIRTLCDIFDYNNQRLLVKQKNISF